MRMGGQTMRRMMTTEMVMEKKEQMKIPEITQINRC
jgi:hypothetical protein